MMIGLWTVNLRRYGFQKQLFPQIFRIPNITTKEIHPSLHWQELLRVFRVARTLKSPMPLFYQVLETRPAQLTCPGLVPRTILGLRATKYIRTGILRPPWGMYPPIRSRV